MSLMAIQGGFSLSLSLSRFAWKPRFYYLKQKSITHFLGYKLSLKNLYEHEQDQKHGTHCSKCAFTICMGRCDGIACDKLKAKMPVYRNSLLLMHVRQTNPQKSYTDNTERKNEWKHRKKKEK